MGVNRNESHIPRKSYPALTPQIIQGYFGDMPEEIRKPLIAGLTRIMSKQAVDERLNYDVIEKFMGSPSSGQRSATLVIAADNSSDMGKGGADYVCDGVNDDVEIGEAIEELIARTGAGNQVGRLVFLEGDFTLGATIAPSNILDLEMWGQGPFITKLFGANTRTMFDFATSGQAPVRVSNMNFEGGLPVFDLGTPGSGTRIDNCRFETTYQAVLAPYDGTTGAHYYIELLNNMFFDCGDTTVTAIVELQQRTFQHKFIGNTFDNTDINCDDYLLTSTHAVQVGNEPIISNNNFERLATIIDHDYGAMTGNVFETDLTMNTCNDWAIAGNVCLGTYTETACAGFSKAGNVGIV